MKGWRNNWNCYLTIWNHLFNYELISSKEHTKNIYIIMIGYLWNHQLAYNICWKTTKNLLLLHIHLDSGANYSMHGFGSWYQRWHDQNWPHDKLSTLAVVPSCCTREEDITLNHVNKQETTTSLKISSIIM